MPNPSSVLPDPRDEARALVRRHLFASFAVVSLAGVLMVGTNGALPGAMRVAASIGFALLALLSVVARRWTGRRSDAAIVGACVAGLLLVVSSAALHGWGVNAPSIGFLAIFTFLIGATVNARLGALIALASAVAVLALGWAEHEHWIRGAAAVADVGLPRRMLNQLILLGVGLAGGLLVMRVFSHYLGASHERERRFHDLLGIAADAYWEMDRQFVINAVWRRQGEREFETVQQPMLPPWEQPDMLFDDGALAAHRADLDARRAFRDLHVRWRRPDGSMRHELVSGEPRFAADGSFLGYWGVSRDISDRVAAAEALRRSEATLSHLVTTSPDLITLTDMSTGRYVMVNDTFARYSGYGAAEVVGRTSLELGIWGQPEKRRELVERLNADGVVRNMPLEFVAKSGQRFSLLVSAARFQMDGGSYLVLNGRDVTDAERTRLAHDAVLANASLGIAFTREQRFVQANPALEKMLGWAPGTLTGEPGRAVWASDAEYAAIGAQIGPALARGEPVELVHELCRRDGTVFWCRMLAKAVDPSHPMGGGTIWIIEDITERRRTEQALAKARDDAEAANEAKSAFLANTSHEIRTPLNGLVGLARLAQRADLDPMRRGRYLDQLVESAESLAAVISDVLDLSKIEAGKLEVESLPFDLRTLLSALGQVYRTLADGRGLGFAVHLAPELPGWVRGDPVRLRQILGNYLSNALKFTATGSIELHAAVVPDGGLRFEVRDTGPGIEPEVQLRLFQPFVQADQSTTRRFGGSGLGLSICRELAGLMGGRVGMRSSPGQGSLFWVELPLPAAAAPQGSGSLAELDAEALAGARVLMVEDNAVNMTIAVAMLEHWGVEVAQAGDGEQAIAAVDAAHRAGRPFHVVLMDVQMPVMSGYEATRRLRARASGLDLPILALTAAALTSEREQALAAGMSGFLTKPIDARRLHAALLDALGARRRAAS